MTTKASTQTGMTFSAIRHTADLRVDDYIFGLNRLGPKELDLVFKGIKTVEAVQYEGNDELVDVRQSPVGQ